MATIIEKIQRLRRLAASSSSPHEAEAAAAAASRLAQEHQIAEAELEVDEGVCGEVAAVSEEALWIGRSRRPYWLVQLACLLAEHHGCSVCTTRWQNAKIIIAGRPTDVAIVRALFGWISVDLLRFAPKKDRRAQHSFLIGGVVGVMRQLERARREVRAVASSTALAVIDSRTELAHAAFGKVKPAPSTKLPLRDAEAFAAGCRHGEGLHLGAHLDAERGVRALSGGAT